MNCKLTLYSNSEIRRDRNCALEALDDYLTARIEDDLTLYNEFENVQFLKLYDAKVQEVKIPFVQELPFGLSYVGCQFDYARVEFWSDDDTDREEDPVTIFFFIDDVEWASRSALRLYMTCDSVQTYFIGTDRFGNIDLSSSEGSSVKLGPKTVVTREHKNRWYKCEYRSAPPSSALIKTVGRARIDRYDEGMQVPLVRTRKTEVKDIGAPSGKWNVIYRNLNDPDPSSLVNPVEVFIAEDHSFPISQGTPSTDITAETFRDYFPAPAALFLKGSYTIHINNVGYTMSASDYAYAIVVNVVTLDAPPTISLVQTGTYVEDGVTYKTVLENRGAVLLETSTVIRTNAADLTFYYDANQFLSIEQSVPTNWNFHLYEPGVLSQGVEEPTFDRTDAKLIKVIKPPYCPIPVRVLNNEYVFPSFGFSFDTTYKMYKLNDPSLKFDNKINISQFLSDLELTWTSLTPEGLVARNDARYETKLLCSQFTSLKFVYDSFAMEIPMECVSPTWAIDTWVTMDFKMTSTINSRFLFQLEIDPVQYLGDYNFTLNVSRNNEATLFNSSYINYVRTGYNYDIKAKNRAGVGAALGAGASIAGGLAGLALTGNPVVAAAGATIGLVTSLISTVNSQVSAADNIAQKLQTAEYQAASVMGSDDIDLLEAYANNHAYIIKYEPPTQVYNALADLFYYCGYACNEKKIPDLTTRTLFNFIQCEPELENHQGMLVPKWAMDDIRERFKEGMTIVHSSQCELGTLDPTYENLETTFETITIYQ